MVVDIEILILVYRNAKCMTSMTESDIGKLFY